jgi:O-antigen/teichoic acid export membrane protein
MLTALSNPTGKVIDPKYLRISLQYMLFISVPSSFGIISLAPDIIMLFAGDQFTPAIVSIRLLAPVIIIVGLAGFLGFQLLYPLRQEWKYTVSVSIAAVCNACCNYLLIPRFQQNGAIIGTLVAETIGVMLQLWFARKYLKETQLFSLNTCKYFVAAGGMFLLLKVNPIPQDRVLIHCMVGVVLGSFSYILFLFLIKEQVMVSIAAKIAHVHKR